jgi:hypothetical protein
LTGLAKPFAILRRWRKKYDVISDIAPSMNPCLYTHRIAYAVLNVNIGTDVDFAFHALSLNEKREPFAPMLMRGDHTLQVFFPGTHSDLGWIGDTTSLVHGPLAWMVEQAHTFLNIQFDELKLKECFPDYRSEGAGKPIHQATWYKAEMERPNCCVAIIGKRARKPGRVNTADGHTDLKVHIGARLRNHAAAEGEDGVPGYRLAVSLSNAPFWTQRPRRSSANSLARRATRLCIWRPQAIIPDRAAARIEEAPVGALEARCLGLPIYVVRD